MRRLLVLPLIASCNAILGVEPAHIPTDGAGADAIGTMTDGGMCVGGRRFSYCFDGTEPPSLDVPTSVDTSSCATRAMDADGQNVCVFAGGSVTVHSMTATGKIPLAIVALADLHIVGTVDVSSPDNGDLTFQGAGANPTSCSPLQIPSGDGGAAGASNQSAGGDGGGIGLASGGHAGSARMEPTGITGGCQGGVGGGNATGGGLGNGGFGGGAIDFVAGTSIAMTTTAAVFAAGGGGTGAGASAGGGGGGAGGLIGFDAPSIMLAGQIAANGGGGGAGADPNTKGDSGREGSTVTSPSPAPGGASPTPGGQGATGTDGAKPGSDGSVSNGGGGGGGGMGWVVAHGVVVPGTTASISPSITKD